MSPKVFGIGFNKTATTSMTSMLKQYGLKTIHHGCWHHWVRDKQFSKFDNYDAFTDGQQKDFRVLDKKYPGSKFILNTRPLNSWMTSRWCHVETNKRTNRSSWKANSKEDLKSWAYSRDNYHADFMILDIQTMSVDEIFNDLDRVLKGVSTKIPSNRSIPRSNSTNASLKNQGKKAVNDALEELGFTQEDKTSNIVSQYFYKNKYPKIFETNFYNNVETNPKMWYKALEKIE